MPNRNVSTLITSQMNEIVISSGFILSQSANNTRTTMKIPLKKIATYNNPAHQKKN